jgi:hypothetical protein
VKGGLQSFYAFRGLAPVQRGDGAEHGQVRESDERILRETLVEIVGKRLGPRGIAHEAQGKSRGVFDVAAVIHGEGRGGVRLRLVGVPVKAFPYGRGGLIDRRRFTASLMQSQILRPGG